MATSNAVDARRPTGGGPGGDATNTDRPIREATVFIGDEGLESAGVADLVAVWRDAGLQAFEVLAADRRGAVVQLEVGDRSPEGRLAARDAVDRWERVPTTSDGERYVVAFTAPRFPPSLAVGEAGLLGARNVDVTDHGVTVTLVGTQPALAAVLERYERRGLAPDLRRIGPYDGLRRTLDVLTERQREAVTTAFELGYYEVPRETTTDAVAAELGLDASTVTEHLQRAERNLLERQLSN